MPTTVKCPHCGHVLFAIDLPIAPAVQARKVSQPDAPLLFRVGEAARLLGVSPSTMCRKRIDQALATDESLRDDS